MIIGKSLCDWYKNTSLTIYTESAFLEGEFPLTFLVDSVCYYFRCATV